MTANARYSLHDMRPDHCFPAIINQYISMLDNNEGKGVIMAEEKTDSFGRSLHTAKCADCGKDCEVPFKPSGDRPVYCRLCLPKHRKTGRRF